jgi:hypothetical protein
MAQIGNALYGLVFLLFGLYACLLLWTAMAGRHSATNTFIAGCGIVFIVRALFVVRAALSRFRARESILAGPWRASGVMLGIGDAIVCISLAWTAYVFWSNEDRLNVPVAPFGIGLACTYIFYGVGFLMRLRDK